VIELAHGSIDERITGASFLPRGQPSWPVVPGHSIVGRLESVADDTREVVEDHEIEVTPDQLVEPGRVLGVECRADQFADADGAEAQVHRQVGNPLDCREVAQGTVALDTCLAELVPQGTGARHAGLYAKGVQVGRLEADIRQRRDARQRAASQLPMARPFGAVGCGQPLQPGIFVRREYGESLAGLGQYLIAIKDRLILESMKLDAIRPQ